MHAAALAVEPSMLVHVGIAVSWLSAATMAMVVAKAKTLKSMVVFCSASCVWARRGKGKRVGRNKWEDTNVLDDLDVQYVGRPA